MRNHRQVFHLRVALLGLCCALSCAAPASAYSCDDMENLQQKVRTGDARALNIFGDCHFHGLGVAKDEARAAEMYRRAAELGDANGQASLGSMYYTGRGGLPKDERRAVELFRQAAEQGNARAQGDLGWMYYTGRGGLPKDERRAAELFRQAAEQGDARAQGNLGWMYYYGRGGLPKDERRALELYRKSAEQGREWARKELQRLGKL